MNLSTFSAYYVLYTTGYCGMRQCIACAVIGTELKTIFCQLPPHLPAKICDFSR